MMGKNCSFKFGIHPINWVGEDVIEHGYQYSYEQVLDEIAELGFKGTEVSRKSPKDIDVLQKELKNRNLTLTTQWKSVLLSDGKEHERQLTSYRKHLEFLKQFDCKVVSTAEIGGSILNQDPRRGENETDVLRLNTEEWKYLSEGLNEAGQLCKDYGMQLVYHHHAGTVVEQPEEIDRLMDMTDPNLVFLLYDTGHGYFGDNDPLELLRKHYDRIRYIHFKDVRKDILDELKNRPTDFRTFIKKGMFTVPGDGCIDFKPILKEIIDREYDGWILIEGEQDPDVYNPYEYAKRSKSYIENIVNEITQQN
jgi:inosose dehydratase